MPVDSNDLAAVCEANKRMLADELAAARAAAAAVPPGATLPDVVNAYARLGGVLSFSG